MKLQLILVDQCSACKQSERLWHDLSQEYGVSFEVLRLTEPDGQRLAETLSLKTFPALLVDGTTRLVGTPSRESARALLERLVAN
jgi:thiol-disulfide isomerase/thioredoxin